MNKPNSKINKVLLAGDKLMPELHLVNPIVKKYCTCDPFAKHKKFKIFFDKKSKGSGLKENQGNFLQNSQLADELHKSVIRKFKKEKCFLYLETIFGMLIWLICN